MTTIAGAQPDSDSGKHGHPAQVTPSATPPTAALRLVGLLGGTSRAVATDGRYVVAGVGLQLAVYDSRSPTPLEMVGRLAPLPAFPFKIVVRDGLAYLGFVNRSIMRVSVADPTQPVAIDETPIPKLEDFDVGDGLLFAAADGKLSAFDTRSQAALKPLGVFGDPLLSVLHVAVDGERVYAQGIYGRGSSRMEVVHLLMPLQAGWSVSGRMVTTLSIAAIAASGNRLLAVGAGQDHTAKLWSWKIDLPSDPPGAGILGLPRFALTARLEGTMAVLGLSNRTPFQLVESGQFALADLTDAKEPKLLASLDTPDNVYGALSVAGLAYLAQNENGPRLVDVADPSVPFDGPEVPTLGAANAIAVADGFAYVLHGYMDRMRRLVAVDLARPDRPVAMSSEAIPDGEGSGRVAVSGDRVSVFTTDFVSGTHIARYDRRRPDQLRPIDSVDIPPPVENVLMDGDRVYVWGDGQIRVLDLAIGPLTPLAQFPVSGTLASMSVRSNHLFFISACCTPNGNADDLLTVFDLADASHPVERGRLRLAAHNPNRRSSPLEFSSNEVGIVSTSSAELVTVDIADPRQLRLLGRTGLPLSYRGVAVTKDKAFLYDFFGDWPAIVDISNPAAPRFEGKLDRSLFVVDAAAYQGRFVLAAMDAGLVVLAPEGLEIPTSAPPTPSATITPPPQPSLPPPTPNVTPVPPSPSAAPPPTATESPGPRGRALLPWLAIHGPTATAVPPRP